MSEAASEPPGARAQPAAATEASAPHAAQHLRDELDERDARRARDDEEAHVPERRVRVHDRVLAELHCEEADGVRTITASGELDISNLQALDDLVCDLPNGDLGLVLDLREVTFIDSATIRLLFSARTRLARRGQEFIVVSLGDSPTRRVLELTGYPTQEDALATSAAQAAAAMRERLKTTG